MKKILSKSPGPIALFVALALTPAPLLATCNGLGVTNYISCTGNSTGNLSSSYASGVLVEASEWTLDNGSIYINTSPEGIGNVSNSAYGNIGFKGENVTVTNGNANGSSGAMVHIEPGMVGAAEVYLNNSELSSTVAGTGGVIANASISKNSYINLSHTNISVVDSIGVSAKANNGESLIILDGDSKITVTASSDSSLSYGLFAEVNEGRAQVITYDDSEIITIGNNATAIKASSLNGSSATNDMVYVETFGTIKTTGNNSHGIDAVSRNDVSVNINNYSDITTQGDNAQAIRATSDAGYIFVVNKGDIVTQGINSTAVFAEVTENNSRQLYILNEGKITTQDAQGIVGRAPNGNVYINAYGDITTRQTATGNNITGIEGANQSDGEIVITYADATLTVVDSDDNGGSSIGILAWDQGSGAADVDGGIRILDGAIVDASRGATAVQMQLSGWGYIDIGADSKIYGGSHAAVSFVSTGNSAAQHSLNNAGEIEAVSDRAIISDVAGAGSKTFINNSGIITGYMNFEGSDVTFNNFSNATWNLRNFADTNGDGVRDTKGVAISDFGSGEAAYTNDAFSVLRLLAVSGDTLPADLTGQYLPVGASSISNAGIVQGQLLNLNTFDNQGIIDLTDNGLAGDVLVISGGNTAGVYGGNQFISNGGMIFLDTVLNEGGANSITDMLVLDDVVTGANGATNIYINHVGGTGSATVDDGIKIIEVLGTSDTDSFVLGSIVKTGIYEYTLHQGSLVDANDQSWYLRNFYIDPESPNTGNPDPNNPDPNNPGPGNPDPGPDVVYLLNPDIGSYLGNQTAATTLFMHSLHDRLGEPQYAKRYKTQEQDSSMWLRTVARHSKNKAAYESFKQSNQSYLIHMGGDVAQWTNNGQDGYHLGLMGAYGHNETSTRSILTGSKVKGSIKGYGGGVYFTWYDNYDSPEGWYADIWSMYNWFDNKTESIHKYHSKVWTSSLELGYAVKFAEQDRWQWMLEPHGQVAYTHYSSKDQIDASDMQITDADANGVMTYLGGRIYIKDSFNKMNAQPFVEANWIHAGADNSLKFNGEKMSDELPKNRFETKIGVQGAVTDNIQVYSHIGLQWGKKQYQASEGQLGLKIRF